MLEEVINRKEFDFLLLRSTKNKSTEFSRCFCFWWIADNDPARFSAQGALVCAAAQT